MTRQDFTNKFFPMAVEATKGTPIFPETVIAAAGLESGWNTSQLSSKYNNFFGFKNSVSWTGKTVSLPTQEEINGKTITVNASFRVYSSPVDSFKDYVRLVQTPRYANAGVTTAKDSIAQFQALQDAGYATDSKYSSKLSSVYYSIKSFFVDSSTYVSDYLKNVIADNPKISAAAGVGLIAVIVVIASMYMSKTKKK